MSIIAGINGMESQVYEPSLFLPPHPVFSLVTGFAPSFLTRGNESSGDLRDAAADALLAATGTGLYQRYRSGRRGVAVAANATGWNAAILDFANTNTLFGGWIGVDDAVAAQRTVIGRYGGTIYLIVSVQSSGAGGGLANEYLIQSTDGAVAKTIQINKVATDGVPRLILVHRDRTMNMMRTWICGLDESPVTGEVDITTQGTLTGGATPKFTMGFAAGAQNGDDSWYGGTFCRINADMTGAGLIGLVGSRLLAYATRGAG